MAYTLISEDAAVRDADGVLVRFHLESPYYQEYLDWIAEGNTPSPIPELSPGPNYLAFWDALVGSTVYGSIREQSFVSLPMNTLATEFIALIGDAKAGRANEAAIQASISAILSVGTFSEEQRQELGDALAQGNLDSIYSIA
jgi:hypothetical protein